MNSKTSGKYTRKVVVLCLMTLCVVVVMITRNPCCPAICRKVDNSGWHRGSPIRWK